LKTAIEVISFHCFYIFNITNEIVFRQAARVLLRVDDIVQAARKERGSGGGGAGGEDQGPPPEEMMEAQ
jgi:hypothetical protein